MDGYTEEEIRIAYSALLKYDDLTKYVPCKCKGNLLCYPHYLLRLREMHNPTKACGNNLL